MEYREKLDKSMLESLKDKIQNYLQSKGLKTVDFIRQNMDSVENLYVEASDTRKLPKMESRGAKPDKTAEIMINKMFIKVDENDKPVNIDKKLRKLIHSQLGHELLHAAARFDGYTGIINNKNNRGLNEGLTQMFTEKIFGYVVSPNSDGYKDYKKFAKILDITFGEDVTLDSYFNHTNALEEKCNELSGDDNFYRSVNDVLTSMYNIKDSNFKKDKYYGSLMQPIYDRKNELVFQKLCAQIIVPKLRTMSQEDQKKYLTEILESVKDDSVIGKGLEDTIINFGSMSQEQLQQEIKRIDRQLKNVEQRHEFTNQLYSESDYYKLVTISDDGKIHPKSNEKITINNETLQEKILSGLYFQDRNFTEEDKKKFAERVVNKCETLDKSNTVNFGAKGNPIEKKKTLSAMKYMAKQNGYLVLNSLAECEQADSIELSAIKAPTEKEPLSFQDLKKLYEAYTIDYEEDVNNQWKMVVKNRNTNEQTDNLQLAKIAKFASVWAEATGTKWMADEKIKGMTYAFSEESEQIFNQLGTMISNNITENGTINTKAIYDEISNGNYKYSKEIIHTLFANPVKLGIIYDFYKMQTPEARMETKLAKTSSEFTRRVNPTEYRKVQAEEIVGQINPTSITDSTIKTATGKEEIDGVTGEIRRDKTRNLEQAQQKE